MNPIDADILARKLLKEHNLNNWGIVFMNSKRIFGQCRHRNNTIALSKLLVELNSEEKVKDTILHEIAHALTPGNYHNSIWKRKAISIGSSESGIFLKEDTITPPAKYHYQCPNCKKVYNYHHKLGRENACTICCKGIYNKKFKLVLLEDS